MSLWEIFGTQEGKLPEDEGLLIRTESGQCEVGCEIHQPYLSVIITC